MTWLRDLRPAILAGAPKTLALLTAAAGIMLLASGATPSDPDRFMWLAEHAPIVLIEISHFLSSILGIVLILLAFGLSRRLDGAWVATLVVQHGGGGAGPVQGVQLGGVDHPPRPRADSSPRATRRFPAGRGCRGWRSARAGCSRPPPPWSAPASRAGGRSSTSTTPTSRCSRSSATRTPSGPCAPPSARRSCCWASASGACWRPPRRRRWSARRTATSTASAQRWLQAEVAEPWSNLALRGDKRFLFSDSGDTFLMFGVRGRSWIALGPPVGRRDERLDLLWAFRELADAHAARPGIYGVTPGGPARHRRARLLDPEDRRVRGGAASTASPSRAASAATCAAAGARPASAAPASRLSRREFRPASTRSSRRSPTSGSPITRAARRPFPSAASSRPISPNSPSRWCASRAGSWPSPPCGPPPSAPPSPST